MSTTRARQLEKLSMSLPGQNQQFADQQQAARQTQLQQQIKKASPSAGPQLAQQLGGQHAAAAGQINVEAAGRTQTQQQQIGQEGLAEKSRESRATGFEQQIALTEHQRDMADKLSRVDRTMKNRLLDDQLEFNQDRAGQTFLNQRQLADWAAVNARSKEEYAEYAQTAMQVQERELQLLGQAYKKISQALNQGYVKEGKELDRNQRRKLAQQKIALEKSIQKKKNQAKNRAAMWQAGGTIVGAAAGAVLLGPGGAAAGAQLGAGAGQMAGAQAEKSRS